MANDSTLNLYSGNIDGVVRTGANPARLAVRTFVVIQVSNCIYRLFGDFLATFPYRFCMRSTKASAAVTRLNTRDTAYRYSMGITASGFFYLLRASAGQAPEKISEDLTQEEFIELVNQMGPQKKVKISRHDAAFEQQLKRSR